MRTVKSLTNRIDVTVARMYPNMNCQLRLLITFILSNLRGLVEGVYSTEDDILVRSINSVHTTWRARVNPPDVLNNIEASLRLAKDSNVLNKSTLPTQLYNERFILPPVFDARENWPKCKNIIGHVRDQGACGSCWAVQTAAMLSDRICIESRGSKKINLSAEDLMACCNCGGNEQHSCKGGDADKAMRYWMEKGIVTGGDYGSNEGCRPYSMEAFEGNHTKCKRRCTNRGYNKSYVKDKNFGKKYYIITAGEKTIQIEIMRYGPVAAFMMAFSDLKYYKDGVYNYTKGRYEGPHIVKIIGWGEKKNVKYWLCMNSWGTDWGRLGGYFKILRGSNHCQIESMMRAGRTQRRHSAREAQVDRASKENSYKASSTQCLTLIFILMGIVSTNQ